MKQNNKGVHIRKEINEMEPVVKNDTASNNKGGMLKKVKMILLIFMGIAALFLVACVAIKSYNHSKYQDEFYVQQQALKYMQERYNEEFIVMYNRGMGGAYNYVQLYAYPITHRDEMHKIEIQGYYNKWGKLDFYDDYVMVRLTEEYEAYVAPIIDEYFDEYKFYIDFNAEWLTNNLPTDTQLEDLWELDANADYPLPRVFLYLRSCEEEKYNDSIIQKLSQKLQENNYRGVLSMIIYYDDSFYNKRNRENIYEDIGARGNNVDGNTIIIYSNKIKY